MAILANNEQEFNVMITNLLVTALLTLSSLVTFLIPDLPDAPQALVDIADSIGTLVGGSLGLLGMIFTVPLVIAVAFTTIAVISWTTVYNSVGWIWRKIPFLNSIKL